MSKPRWFEILDVAVQILKLVIATAADIVDDGKINGSINEQKNGSINEQKNGSINEQNFVAKDE